MVKKVLSLLATLTLVTGSVTSTTAWTEHKNQNGGDKQKQTPQSSQNYNDKEHLFKQDTNFIETDVDSLYAYNNVVYLWGGDGAFGSANFYESKDNGQTWTKNNSFSTYYDIDSIYAYNKVVYIVGKDFNKNSYYVYESDDNGKTWTKNTTLTTDEIYSIYAYNNVVYAETVSGLYESTDNGQNFKQNESIPYHPGGIDSIYAYNNVVYAGGDGLYESTDNGQTFKQNESVQNLQIYSIIAYNNVVYAIANSSLYESNDHGTTFKKNTSIPSDEGAAFWKTYLYNNVLYIGTSHGLYESTDNGQTFHENSSIPKTSGIHSIYAYNNFLYVATDFGLYELNGQTFHQNSSIKDLDTYSIYAYNNVVYVCITGEGESDGLYKSYVIINYPNENEILNQTYNYLMYSNPINFTFDWTLLSKVTISNNSSKTPITKTLTSGSYQIKDDGNYTVTFDFKDSTIQSFTQRFLLQNGYDFSQGINAATWDPTTSYLNIYLNQEYMNFLENGWNTHAAGSEYLLQWINNYSIKEGVWQNLLVPKNNLENQIEGFIPTPSGEKPTFSQLNIAATWPKGTGSEDDYSWALQNKIKSLNPTKGLVFKMKIAPNRYITKKTNPSLGEVPLNPYCKEKTQEDIRTSYSNYWDEVLFNQN